MQEHFSVELIGDGKLNVRADQTILEASLAAGIPHYHACGGKGQCSTCRILITEGGEDLLPLSDDEKQLRLRVPFPANIRLACQAYVKGTNLKVHRMIRDEADIKMYIQGDTKNDLEYIGEEKELALFFLDIRNFTPFMETYLPFDVIHIMRRLFSLFRQAIEANDGRIIETGGDGFYAVFGFNSSIVDAVQNSCNAGFKILSNLNDFNDSYIVKNFNHRFQVGIGVHCGNIIYGDIGIGVNNNLTVMGLPVNIASRLQAATKDFNNSFIMSDIAYSLLKEKPKADMKEAHLKGIKEKVLCHLIGEAYK